MTTEQILNQVIAAMATERAMREQAHEREVASLRQELEALRARVVVSEAKEKSE